MCKHTHANAYIDEDNFLDFDVIRRILLHSKMSSNFFKVGTSCQKSTSSVEFFYSRVWSSFTRGCYVCAMNKHIKGRFLCYFGTFELSLNELVIGLN